MTHNNLWFRIALQFMALIVVAFMLQGCLPGPKQKSASAVVIERANKSGWMLVYADKDIVRAYKNEKIGNLGVNPAGYKSLDHWIGYSSQLRAVMFHRFLEDNFRLLETDMSGDSMKSRKLTKAFAEECEPQDYLLHDGKLWVVRGVRHKAELWSCDTSAKWKRAASWSIPKNIPVPRKWSRAPAIDGSTVAFMSPSDYLLLSDTAGGTVKVLSEGDPNYGDPGYDDTGSGEIRPVMSPGGEWVFFRATRREDLDDLKILALNCRTGDKRMYKLEKQMPSSPLLGPPSTISTLHWVPGSDCIACEIHPRWSGLSYIALLDTCSGDSEYLPVAVERHQWCVVGAVKDSSETVEAAK